MTPAEATPKATQAGPAKAKAPKAKVPAAKATKAEAPAKKSEAGQPQAGKSDANAPGAKMDGSKLVILDGHGIIYRAYFAVREPLIVQRTGETVTAVYGFTNTLLRVIDELQPTHIAVAMDPPGPTFRHEADETYKAHRPETPDDLPPQIERTVDVIRAFNIPIYEVPGFEADDVLATLADQSAAAGVETWIATLDSDLLQLVRPGVNVFMYRPYQRDTVLYNSAERVRDRYGIDPIQVIDYKGLKGDASDNIPGVPGIGEKTAVKLLNEYPTIEAIYDHLDEVTPPRAQKALTENRELAFHSKEMATIRHDVPVELDLDGSELQDFDRGAVVELFRDLEFRSLINRLPEPQPGRGGAAPRDTDQIPTDYAVLRSAKALRQWLADAAQAPLLALSPAADGDDPMTAAIAGYALAVSAGQAVYAPVAHANDGEPQLDPGETLKLLKPVLEDAARPKVLHNAKFATKLLRRHGVTLRGVQEDTMLAAYLLGESSVTLRSLALERFALEIPPLTDLLGTGQKQIALREAPAGDAAIYGCTNADLLLRLQADFAVRLAEEPQLSELYTEMELPLSRVLAEIELRGVALDADAIRAMGVDLEKEIDRHERAIYKAAGQEFNIGSPKQLSVVLFEELELPKSRKVTHGYSTDVRALERLIGAHPIVELIMQYREVSKLKSTYVDTLPELVHPETGRIHTDYNQAVAATGRLSSENPNLQNIPIRTETGREIRRAFIPRNGEDVCFLAADYSQIELRVLAHLSRDEHLIEAFRDDEDIHAATASVTYGVDPADVTPDMRRIAKMMNFGVIYGLTDFGLAQRANIGRKEARGFIDAYFGRFDRVAEWLEEIKVSTKERGYAETLLGRRRYVPEIRSPNFQVRAAAERVAVNMPVQGTGADVIKRAMLQVDAALAEREAACRMILSVHDELIFELPEREVPETAALLQAIMPLAIEMIVPLKIELKRGPNWGDLEPYRPA